MRQVGIDWMNAITVAEHAGIFHLHMKLICEHIAILFHHIECFGEIESLLTIFFLVDHKFKSDVFAKAISVDYGACIKIAASGRISQVR